MIFRNLNEEQISAVKEEGNVMICACPGSGKTRVLTRRIAYEIDEKVNNQKQYICALTYTNRAADEIKSRIDKLNINTKQLWAGTIHTFCLEWIMRPNAGLINELKHGFTIVDEYYSTELMNSIKKDLGIKSYVNIPTRFIRNDYAFCGDETCMEALNIFYDTLLSERKVSFDLILKYAYQIISTYPLVAKSLSNIFKVI